MDTVDTLERAVAILEHEMATAPGSFAHSDRSNVKMLAQALGSVLAAAAFAGAHKRKVMALLQSQTMQMTASVLRLPLQCMSARVMASWMSCPI